MVNSLFRRSLVVGLLVSTTVACAPTYYGGYRRSDPTTTAAVVGAVAGAVTGAIAGAVVSNRQQERVIVVPQSGYPYPPYPNGYPTGYVVNYPECPFIMPTATRSGRNIFWTDPPTDPRCVQVLMWYDQIHRQYRPYP